MLTIAGEKFIRSMTMWYRQKDTLSESRAV
jgi:hypothetical protein